MSLMIDHSTVLERLPCWIPELTRYVAIESISSVNLNLATGAEFAATAMKEIGFDTTIINGYGAPVVFGSITHPQATKTVLLYGHYDVQPAEERDGWLSPPFVLTERDDRLWGRGVGDNKGQHFAHWKAIELLRDSGMMPAVNIKMMLDGEEEVGSPHLNSFVAAHRALLACDFVYTADGPRMAGNLPLLLGGCRGTLSFTVTCATAIRDCHSGGFGGAVPNAALRLIACLNHLFDGDGRCRLAEFYASVAPVRDFDRALLARIPYDVEAFSLEMGVAVQTDSQSVQDLLERVRLQPYCNVSCLKSGYLGEGFKNIIPHASEAHVDVRLVPDQDPHEIFELLKCAAHDFDPGVVLTQRGFCYPASRTSLDSCFAQTVTAALTDGFKQAPVLVPSAGGSLPDFVFTQTLGVPSFITGYATHDERNHAPNENLSIEGLVNGVVASARLFLRLGCLGQREKTEP
jgi:acetylornithine deacetylase/succinyl-diaminopimelate desuccinylase-like protein